MNITKFIIFVLLSLSLNGLSQEKHIHELLNEPTGIQSLSDNLRNLLKKEMLALQSGMMSIIPVIVSGNFDEIAVIAKQMKNSYILKQSLTDNQMHELHSKLSSDFIEKDQQFHYLAGMLEQSASDNKTELIHFYFSKMIESCSGCHAKYATHKFTNLLPIVNKNHHSH